MSRLPEQRLGSVSGAFRWCKERNCKHIATSLALILTAVLVLAGVVWLNDAYTSSRFTLAPAGCPLARVSAWNTDVAPACWGMP